MATKILVVGAGKMGSALINGWLAQGMDPGHICVADPALSERASPWPPTLRTASSPEPFQGEDFDLLLLAVKPQIMEQALEQVSSFDRPGLTVVSIAAGVRLERYVAAFPSAHCIRAMPNTPAAVGQGVTVCVGHDPTDEVRALIDGLMAAVGAVLWITDEADMDAVTALSGSGPAYVFHLVEALAAAGLAAGLSEDISQGLARQTVIGAGALLDQSDEPASVLRQNVTSPGGTTAAGLGQLQDTGDLKRLMTRTVLAAKARSEELS